MLTKLKLYAAAFFAGIVTLTVAVLRLKSKVKRDVENEAIRDASERVQDGRDAVADGRGLTPDERLRRNDGKW